MTIRELAQCCLDAIGGALFIACIVLALTYLPGLALETLREWLA